MILYLKDPKNSTKKLLEIRQAPLAHTCNHSYSGGRDQEDCISKPGKWFHETLFQNTLHKNRVGGVTQGEGPEFKLQDHKKKITNSFNKNSEIS
jgi:hypothetical protein